MDYRLITRWGVTEEVNEQYFPTYCDADIIIDYLQQAVENGAKISWVLQERTKDGKIISFASLNSVGDWEKLNWNV